MHEVRFHGSAGQGILTASRLFAQAAIADGKYAQAFPDFGPERLGAPFKPSLRIDDQPIEIRSQVYTPNAVAVFEESLLAKVPTRGMVSKGYLVVNSNEKNSAEVKKMGEEAESLSTSLMPIEDRDRPNRDPHSEHDHARRFGGRVRIRHR